MANEFTVDRTAAAFVVGLGFVVWPAVIGATLYELGVLDPAGMSPVDIGVAVGSALIGMMAPRHVYRQLRGAFGVTISEEGITAGDEKIAWAEVTAIERPIFGTLLIKAGEGPDSRQITLQTYLFTGREQLEKFVQEHAPAVG